MFIRYMMRQWQWLLRYTILATMTSAEGSVMPQDMWPLREEFHQGLSHALMRGVGRQLRSLLMAQEFGYVDPMV